MPLSPSHFSNASPPPQKVTKTGVQTRGTKRASEITNEEINENIMTLRQIVEKGQQNIENKIVNLVRENCMRKEEISTNSEAIKSLCSSHDHMTRRLNDLEQDRIKNFMEITGVRAELISNGTPLKDLIYSLFASYSIHCEPGDIDRSFVRYIQRSGEKTPIITIVFANYQMKLHVMKTKKDNDCANASKIYFSHALTPHKRSLFAKARELGRELNIRYVFIADGHIFMKDENAAKGVCIKSIEDLENLKKNRKAIPTAAARNLNLPCINDINDINTNKIHQA